ncbi:MAG: DsrE family protein [Burkholderiales bacterium]|nr:DsrE family protein [Burkholderiales bacterium]
MIRLPFLLLVLLGLLLGGCAGTPAEPPRNRAVYHISEAGEQPVRAMQFIRNHLEANPKAVIAVVTHAAGVDFLMKGAKTERGNAYLTAIEDLELLEVRFLVCEITLRERNLTRDRFVDQAAFVRSGVAELARLQSDEGYAYVKP